MLPKRHALFVGMIVHSFLDGDIALNKSCFVCSVFSGVVVHCFVEGDTSSEVHAFHVLCLVVHVLFLV